MKPLETVLADALEEVPILKKHGQQVAAAAIEQLCADVAAATEDYRTWLSESNAMLRSGKGKYWLRSHFGDWARCDMARWSPKNKRAREYRSCIIPMRSDWAKLQNDAVSAARGEGAA